MRVNLPDHSVDYSIYLGQSERLQSHFLPWDNALPGLKYFFKFRFLTNINAETHIQTQILNFPATPASRDETKNQ